MKSLAIRALAALCILAPAAPAGAQEQTVESAHAFLGQVFGAGGVQFSYEFGGKGFNVVTQEYYTCRNVMVFAGSDLMGPQYEEHCGSTQSTNWNAPPYTNTRYATTGRCLGRLTANAPSYTTQWQLGRTYYTRHTLSPADMKVFWDRVADVSQSGTQVTISVGAERFQFILPSESLATRVAYAMEFLHQNCDPTAGTGF